MKKRTSTDRFAIGLRAILSAILVATIMGLIAPISALGADKLVVKNDDGTTTFRVTDTGGITSASKLLANGASSVGSAPMVLGQNTGNRGIVITDKAAANPKRIYFGWNPGASFDYAEIFALQEGVAYKNLVLVPNGGNVGVGTTSPSFPLQMGSGAYVSLGGVWTNASSREYKKDIRELTGDEAMHALKELRPVKFRYKAALEENHVGFIAEDVPALLATKDRKGMGSMDVVAVLTKVIKEQQESIAELSRKVAELESRVK